MDVNTNALLITCLCPWEFCTLDVNTSALLISSVDVLPGCASSCVLDVQAHLVGESLSILGVNTSVLLITCGWCCHDSRTLVHLLGEILSIVDATQIHDRSHVLSGWKCLLKEHLLNT